MRDNLVERLFYLFAPADRAVALAGDLAEEREQRGWMWHWMNVVLITFALWRGAATDAPLRVFALVLTGLALLVASAIGGFAAIFLVPQWADSAMAWIVLLFLWWGGALWTGATLVGLAPLHGVAACSTLAVGGGTLLTGFGGLALLRDPGNTDFVFFWALGLMAVIPLLTGAAVARRRLAGLPQEQPL